MPPAHAHPGRFTCLSHQAGPTIHQHYSGLSHPLLILPRLVLPYQSHPGRSRSTSCAALRRRSSGSKPPWTMPNRFCSCGLQRGRSVCIRVCLCVYLCVRLCVFVWGGAGVHVCGEGEGGMRACACVCVCLCLCIRALACRACGCEQTFIVHSINNTRKLFQRAPCPLLPPAMPPACSPLPPLLPLAAPCLQWAASWTDVTLTSTSLAKP